MSLWNLIRDWFVEHIWGGIASNGTNYTSNLIASNSNTTNFELPIGDSSSLPLGDWLSTTSTIICLALLVYVVILGMCWLFKVISGLLLLKH